MIVMTLEAVRQLSTSDGRLITGILLKQGQLLAPITVGDTFQDATETNLHLRPLIRAYEKESRWFEARIFSYRDGRWTENFRVEVQVQYEDQQAYDVNSRLETQLYHQRVRQHMQEAMARCANAIETEDFTSYIASRGSHLGKSFRHLNDIRWDGPSSTGAAYINMATAKEHYRSIDSPVHPCILDAALTHLQTSYLFKGLLDTCAPSIRPPLDIGQSLGPRDIEAARCVRDQEVPHGLSQHSHTIRCLRSR